MVFLAAVQMRGLKMAGVKQRWNRDPKFFEGLWKMEFSESPRDSAACQIRKGVHSRRRERVCPGFIVVQLRLPGDIAALGQDSDAQVIDVFFAKKLGNFLVQIASLIDPKN